MEKFDKDSVLLSIVFYLVKQTYEYTAQIHFTILPEYFVYE